MSSIDPAILRCNEVSRPATNIPWLLGISGFLPWRFSLVKYLSLFQVSVRASIQMLHCSEAILGYFQQNKSKSANLSRWGNPQLFVESDGNFISVPAALFSLVRERFIINPSAPPQRKRRRRKVDCSENEPRPEIIHSWAKGWDLWFIYLSISINLTNLYLFYAWTVRKAGNCPYCVLSWWMSTC